MIIKSTQHSDIVKKTDYNTKLQRIKIKYKITLVWLTKLVLLQRFKKIENKKLDTANFVLKIHLNTKVNDTAKIQFDKTVFGDLANKVNPNKENLNNLSDRVKVE